MLALVTGATGFLGSHLVQQLRLGGHRVRALVHNPNKAHVLDRLDVEIVVGDVTAAETLMPAVAGVDVVFHTAALVADWADWASYLATTVQGTENTIEAAIRASVRRFVHISTIRVYDDRYALKHGVVTEESPRGELGFRHFGHYSHAKAMAEAMVWKHQDRIPVTVIRPAWIYGPRDEVILPPLVRYLRGRFARWPSSIDPCADPIFVTDVADCAIAAALNACAVNQAYNAAPHNRIRVREFLGELCSALGTKTPTRSIPSWLASSSAYFWEGLARATRRRTRPLVTHAGLAILSADVRHDPGKAERELGWRSKVELATGIEQTAAWLRRCHPDVCG